MMSGLAGLLLAATPAYSQAPRVTATLTASTNSVYINESFTVTLTLKHTTPIGRHINLANFPPPEQQATFERLTDRAPERWTHGRVLITQQRFAWRAQPRNSGPMVLSPRLTVVARGLGRIQVEPAPLTIQVRTLPAQGRPNDFSGAIGSFALHVEAEPTTVAAGDLVRVVMEVRGNGHLNDTQPPAVTPDPAFRFYDAERVRNTAHRSCVFEQILIPLSTNAVAIPSVTYSYFDPTTADYTTLSSEPIPLAFRDPRRIDQSTPTPTNTATPSGPLPKNRPRTPASLLTMAYWMVSVGLCAGLAATRKRSHIALAVGVASMAMLAFPPLHRHLQREAGTHAILASDATARLAPGNHAHTLFSVTKDTSVQMLETHVDWVRVAIGNKRGWLPRQAIATP